MTAPISWPQILARRRHRQLPEAVSELAVEATVERLCEVQSQVASSADLALRRRRRRPQPGEVGGARAEVDRLGSIVGRDLRSRIEQARLR